MSAPPITEEEAVPRSAASTRPPRDGMPARHRWTRDEYYRMARLGIFPPDARVELIAGEVIEMAPQGPEHASSTDGLRDRIREAFGPGYCTRTHSPLSLGQASDPEPDGAVVRGSHQDYAHAHPTTALLVVEVAHSTLPFDRTTKAGLYAASGIPEYWILNLEQSLLEVHRDPRPDPASPFGASYAFVERLDEGATASPLHAPNVQFRVKDLLPPPAP